MNTTSMIGSLFALSLVFGAPTLTIAHVGHGDEFQAEGGIDRVPVNTDTDALLGIEVTPIAPAADGSSRILVPMTALVDADGNQLAFVQYENFYEPVPVQIGATEGELVEVTEGLSIGEQLVTQGSLSLYAESRKTQTADAATSSETATAPTEEAEAQADTQVDTQGIPQEQDAEGNLAETTSNGVPMGTLAAIGGGVVIIGGGVFFWTKSRRNKSVFSDK
ncbi:cobalt transporter [Sodalinema gerasimenkoae]|uniref:cobalt transporter n=2 Tax=Cyanophyceae TaxID=3028117 RepID=UPI001358DAE1|nr:cobalt transporter [Sodalinema gerasimenkoae]